MIIHRKSTKCVRLIQPVNCFLEFESGDESSCCCSDVEKSTSTAKRRNNNKSSSKNPNNATTTTPTPTKKPIQQQQQRRRVQIDTTLNQVHVLENCQSREENRARWFSGSEMKGFRAALSAESKRLMGGSNTSTTITTTTTTTTTTPQSSSTNNNLSFRKTLKEMLHEQKHVVARHNSSNTDSLTWCEQSYLEHLRQHPEWLGLERFVLDSLTKDDKAQRRIRQVIMIRDVQKSAAKGDKFKCDSNAEFIRQACENANQQSYAIARRMAYIQATHLLSFHEPPTTTSSSADTSTTASSPKQQKNNYRCPVRTKQEQTQWPVDNGSKPALQEWWA